MLSFARSADLKITDEKERCQAYIDNTEQRNLILLYLVIYVEIRQKIIGYCE